MKLWIAYLWGETLIFASETHEEVVNHILKSGATVGIGPMDLGERVWELTPDQYKTFTLITGKLEPIIGVKAS